MPQMMPMYWFIMTIITMMLLMIIMNFMYFFMILPVPSYSNFNSLKMYTWNWKW